MNKVDYPKTRAFVNFVNECYYDLKKIVQKTHTSVFADVPIILKERNVILSLDYITNFWNWIENVASVFMQEPSKMAKIAVDVRP